jgi:hypothetical protein
MKRQTLWPIILFVLVLQWYLNLCHGIMIPKA